VTNRDGPDEQRRPGYLYDPHAPLPPHLTPPPQPPPGRGRLRDVDSAESARRLQLLGWSMIAAILGALIGVWAALVSDRSVLPLAVAGAALLGGFAYFGTLLLAGGVAGAASAIYFSGGSRLPVRRDYSLAESLAVRGRLDEAVAELERASRRWPDDPEPCVRLARMLRDDCARPEDSIRWFRRALTLHGCTAGTELAVARELVEVYTHRLHAPARALPELARLAELRAGTPTGDWARHELAELKRDLPELKRDLPERRDLPEPGRDLPQADTHE
jgi:hypothetical protein